MNMKIKYQPDFTIQSVKIITLILDICKIKTNFKNI